MRLILESYLARAQSHYPVRIISLVVMANHVHLIIVVENPENVSKFVGFFKRETAFAINKLFGRSKRTVWCDGYDSPIILDSEKAIDRLVYSYTNPQSARLVDTIDEYPHLSTWKEMLTGGSVLRRVPVFPRHAVPTLNDSFSGSEADADSIYRAILKESLGTIELKIEPFAWLDCFPDTVGTSPQEVVPVLVKRVRFRERFLQKEKGISVLGREALLLQNIRASYQPKKRGKRMICLSSEKSKRVQYIGWFFEQAKLAKKQIQEWLFTAAPLSVPPGFFVPGGRMFANIFPHFLLT